MGGVEVDLDSIPSTYVEVIMRTMLLGNCWKAFDGF